MNIKKKNQKAIICISLCAILVIDIAACSLLWLTGKKNIRHDAIYMDGVEIVPGETTIGSLYDVGFTVEVPLGDAEESAPEWRTVPFSKDMVLAENSQYKDFYVMKDGVKQARLDVTTENACTLYNAVITSVYVDLSVTPTAKITLGGIELDKLTQRTFSDLFDNSVELDGAASATYPGDIFSVKAQWDVDGKLTKISSVTD